MTDRTVILVILLFGTLVYLALAFGLIFPSDASEMGTFVYNYYFLSLIEGRFDIPLRVIGFEGQYDAAGHAFVPYGMAPLLVRALFYPFVDLKTVSVAAISVWMFSCGGSAVYHLTFAKIIQRFGPADVVPRRALLVLVGLAAWFTSPGILLAANNSIYHEPIAAAYFFTACFLALFERVAHFGARPAEIMVPLAVAAGLTAHSRVHVAIGLYVGVCLLILAHFRREGPTEIGRTAGALIILFMFGASLLLVNELRFENAFQFVGSVERGPAVQHGAIFWGEADQNTPWVRAHIDHGSFNPRRILPNLMIYAIDLPGTFLSDWIEKFYRLLTQNLGYNKIDQPRIGFAFLWAPWILIIREGLSCRKVPTEVGWVMLVATGIAALFIASFTTVSLRYRVDLWPFLAASSLLLLPGVSGLRENSKLLLFVLAATFVLAAVAVSVVLPSYSQIFSEKFYYYSPWSYETCAERVALKGFGVDQIPRLCAL